MWLRGAAVFCHRTLLRDNDLGIGSVSEEKFDEIEEIFPTNRDNYGKERASI